MKLKLIILLIILYKSVFSQFTFNNIYSGSYPKARNIIELNSNYITVGGIHIGSNLFILVKCIDSIGSPIWEKYYGVQGSDWFHGINNSLFKTKDGNYVLAGGIESPVNNYSCLLIKFNSNFDTLWTKTYLQDTIFVTTNNCTQTSDGGFALCGMSAKTDPNDNALLIRTDSIGNILWYKEYGTNKLEYFQKIIETHDKGFLLGGASYSQNDYARGYLVKVDSLGTKEWERFYTSPTGYDNPAIGGLLMLGDSTYLISTAITTNYLGNPFELPKKARLIKLNKNFLQIWSNVYGEESLLNGFCKIIEKNESTIFINGNYFENSVPFTTLTKLDTSGHLIWQKKIFFSDTLCENYGESFTLTSDGGFAIGGWVSNSLATPHQQLWLAKLDSNGCDGIHFCDTATVINTEQFEKDYLLSLFPNPASTFLNIKTNIGTGELSIFNLQGELILLEKVNKKEESIDIRMFPAGVYFVRLVLRNEVIVKKFVKE